MLLILAVWVLTTILIECDRRGRGHIVSKRQPIHGDFDDLVEDGENILFDAETLMPDHQDTAPGKGKLVNPFGAGCLLQADEGKSIGLKLPENRKQRAVELNL